MIAALLLLPALLSVHDIKCAPKQPGFLAGPLVRDEDAARAIFVAVADQFAGGADFSGYRVAVEESPDHRKWIVSHDSSRPGVSQRGGGGMSMTIDKCTGTISQVHYQR